MELGLQMLLPIFRTFDGANVHLQRSTYLFAFQPKGIRWDARSPVTKWEAYQRLLPQELSTRGSDFNEAARQAFSFHHWGHGRQSVAFHQAAGDPCGGCALARWDDDAQPVVSAAPHGAPAGVHHETDQEAERESSGRGCKTAGRGTNSVEAIVAHNAVSSNHPLTLICMVGKICL